jgi:hypothetical protein
MLTYNTIIIEDSQTVNRNGKDKGGVLQWKMEK